MASKCSQHIRPHTTSKRGPRAAQAPNDGPETASAAPKLASPAESCRAKKKRLSLAHRVGVTDYGCSFEFRNHIVLEPGQLCATYAATAAGTSKPNRRLPLGRAFCKRGVKCASVAARSLAPSSMPTTQNVARVANATMYSSAIADQQHRDCATTEFWWHLTEYQVMSNTHSIQPSKRRSVSSEVDTM